MDKYNIKKKKSQEIILYIKKHISESVQSRFNACAYYLAMVGDKDLVKKKLFKGYFCGNRFCPTCRWREAKKDALKISVLMKHIQHKHNKTFLFLTLTAPNVTGDKLEDEITRYNKAFKNLMKRPEVLPIAKGYVRKLEITHNAERKDFHPHFHVLIAVNNSYFTDKTYIKREKWLQMWQQVMNDYSITQVDIRKFKGDTQKEVLEVATYSAKDSDLYFNETVFDYFYKALKGRQILTYSGLFAEANKLYKAKELEHLKDVDPTEYVYFLMYNWGLGEYVEKEKRELTEDEYRQINRQLVDEVDIE